MEKAHKKCVLQNYNIISSFEKSAQIQDDFCACLPAYAFTFLNLPNLSVIYRETTRLRWRYRTGL